MSLPLTVISQNNNTLTVRNNYTAKAYNAYCKAVRRFYSNLTEITPLEVITQKPDCKAVNLKIKPDLIPFLEKMKADIESGRPGKRIFADIYDLNYEVAKNIKPVIADPSTYPAWYGGLKRDKADVLNGLQNLIDGKSKGNLADTLACIAEDMQADYRRELEGEYIKFMDTDCPDSLPLRALEAIINKFALMQEQIAGDDSFDFKAA